jgi:GT2 family glycosyltransferase
MTRISLVIINWNESQTLARCLESFVPDFDFSKDEIIIVDNGSSDDSVSMVEARYPKIRVLKLPANIGVGPARNRGLVIATGEVCMTLDNDTIVKQPIDFGAIADRFKNDPQVGVCGYMLYNVDGTFQGNARRFPGWLQPVVARITPLQKFPPFKRLLDRHLMKELDVDQSPDAIPVDYVLGANQIFRREIGKKLNFYDPKIFFGPEDFDFCYRVKKLGFENYLLRGPVIVHDYRRRTRKFNMITVKHITGFYYIMLKNRIVRL